MEMSMQIAIETVPETASGHRDLVEVSYSVESDRMCVVSRTTITAAAVLLRAALEQVQEMRAVVLASESHAKIRCEGKAVAYGSR
jgi:hypothetical protein